MKIGIDVKFIQYSFISLLIPLASRASIIVVIRIVTISVCITIRWWIVISFVIYIFVQFFTWVTWLKLNFMLCPTIWCLTKHSLIILLSAISSNGLKSTTRSWTKAFCPTLSEFLTLFSTLWSRVDKQIHWKQHVGEQRAKNPLTCPSPLIPLVILLTSIWTVHKYWTMICYTISANPLIIDPLAFCPIIFIAFSSTDGKWWKNCCVIVPTLKIWSSTGTFRCS